MTRITVKRSLIKYIIFSIFTFGIYSLWFVHALARDVNTMCARDGKRTAGLLKLILLSIITFGIYGLYWNYALAKRLQTNLKEQYGIEVPESGVTVLLWSTIGTLLCSIGPFVALHIIIKNTNILAAFYNSGDMHKTKSATSKSAPIPTPKGDDDDIVTLTTQNGEEVDFVEIAGIAHKGNFYAILQPVELLDGMEEDDALVFNVTRTPDDEANFELELNEEAIEAVFEIYNKLLDEAEAE